MALAAGKQQEDDIGTVLERLPFSWYHIAIIVTVSVTGFIEAYSTAATGPLVALTKAQLKVPSGDIRLLVIAPTVTLVLSMTLGGTVLCDRFSRRDILLAGLVWSTTFTALTSLADSPTSLIALRVISGLGMGLALPAAYPIGAELMPAVRRRTFAWIYEIALGLGLTVTAIMGYVAGRINMTESWRIIPLPAIPCLIFGTILILLFVPRSPRWLLARGDTEKAAATLHMIARRAGAPELADDFLRAQAGSKHVSARPVSPGGRQLASLRTLIAPGVRGDTLLAVLVSICVWTPFYLLSTLLPEILVARGFTVVKSLSLVIVLFAVTIPGKFMNGWLMEKVGRPRAIAITFAAALPGVLVAVFVAGSVVGALAAEVILGITALSVFPSARMFVVELFPTQVRGRGNFLAEMSGRLVAGIPIPFILAGQLSSGKLAAPDVIFATAGVFLAVGALLPLLAGRETRGVLEHVERRITGTDEQAAASSVT